MSTYPQDKLTLLV